VGDCSTPQDSSRSANLKANDVIDAFRAAGALLEGHFVLSSGLHSSEYLQCALVLQSPVQAEIFGREIAAHFQDESIRLVASPAIGGLIIGHEVARALGARFIWTEREAGQVTLRRGFTIEPGERTLVVEDVITTGGSTRETIEALRSAGANVVGAASIIDRSSGAADVGVPRIALAALDAPSVDPSVCEACAKGEAATKPGSRKKAEGRQKEGRRQKAEGRRLKAEASNQ
jgi:orotate phosphoribosyltransferase